MQNNRVLIVDDDSRICELLKKVAESQGFQALAIDSPDLLKSSYQGFDPNIILLDLQMQNTDGIKSLRFLADQNTDADISIISGLHRDVIQAAQLLGQSMQLKIDKVYSKPLDIDSIANDLRNKFLDLRQLYQNIEKQNHFELSDAINRANVIVNYQPIIDLASGKVIAIELLARWRDENDHKIIPGNLISVAEKIGLIEALTYFVLDIGLCECNPQLQKNREVAISLKLSSSLFYDLKTPDHLESVLKQYGYEANRLILEVNSEVVSKDFTTAMDVLARLHIKGFRLCIYNIDQRAMELIENFHLPFTEMKLDRMHATRRRKDRESISQIESVIKFGKKLGLKIFADGVESQNVLDLVKQLGCDTAQGLHISQPLTMSALKALLKHWESLPKND